MTVMRQLKELIQSRPRLPYIWSRPVLGLYMLSVVLILFAYYLIGDISVYYAAPSLMVERGCFSGDQPGYYGRLIINSFTRSGTNVVRLNTSASFTIAYLLAIIPLCYLARRWGLIILLTFIVVLSTYGVTSTELKLVIEKSAIFSKVDWDIYPIPHIHFTITFVCAFFFMLIATLTPYLFVVYSNYKKPISPQRAALLPYFLHLPIILNLLIASYLLSSPNREQVLCSFIEYSQ